MEVDEVKGPLYLFHEHRETLEHLHKLQLQAPTAHLRRYYAHELRSLVFAMNIELPATVQMNWCTACSALLIPGFNCVVRMKKRKLSQKARQRRNAAVASGNAVASCPTQMRHKVYRCEECDVQSYFPATDHVFIRKDLGKQPNDKTATPRTPKVHERSIFQQSRASSSGRKTKSSGSLKRIVQRKEQLRAPGTLYNSATGGLSLSLEDFLQ